MPLRHRTPDVDTTPAILSPGLEHLDQRWVALLRRLDTARLDFIVVGPVARAIHGLPVADAPATLVIVPAPYLRNRERLAGVLAAHDDLEVDGSVDGAAYQELLYESLRITLSPGLAVEVASPEDLELDDRRHRAPEFRITRARDREDAAEPARALQDG